MGGGKGRQECRVVRKKSTAFMVYGKKKRKKKNSGKNGRGRKDCVMFSYVAL